MGGRGTGSGMLSRGYTSFSDRAIDEYEFEGDGQAQIDFFNANSNYDELINSMDSVTIAALQKWTRGMFMSGAQYDGWDNLNIREKRFTQQMDDILDKSTLNKGVELARLSDAQLILGKGKTTATLEELQAAKGSIVTSKGAMSFSAASTGLLIKGEKNVEYKLKIPGGSNGSGMWIGDKRINREWGASQREFMVNRDVSVRVGNTTFDKSRNVFVTELEYIGRQEHNYGRSGRLRERR